MERPDSRTYLAFTGTVLIGGANFIAVSMSNEELPPLFGAALRFAAAALLFFVIAGVSRVPLARGRSAAGAILYGLLGFGAAYAFLYYSLVGLSAGATAVILASVPLLTLVIAVALGQERLSMRGVGGGALAIAGIAVLSLDTLGGDLSRSYLVAAVLGAIAAAGSSVVAKSFRDVHPVNMNAFGMAAGTVLLAISSLAFRERWSLPRETETLMAISWLVILGSVGLFQLFLYVIKRWTASATVYALAGMPVIAVVLGALILDQPITAEVLLGGALVIAAVYVGAISGTRSLPNVATADSERAPKAAEGSAAS
jgi:drug/metabolite transporter (DMT)-like permease